VSRAVDGHAFGKVILLGEHAVVHGHPALAGAIDRGVRVRARPGGAGLHLRVPAWGIDVAAGADHPVARALAAIAGGLGVDAPMALAGEADLPAAAGLGSSAALAVAVTRALAAAAGRALADDELIAIAGAGERCFHGNPSGVDVTLAARGGLGLFRRGVGLTPIAAAPLPLLIGLSGETRATAAMVARVGAALAAEPDRTGAHLARLGAAAVAGGALLASPAPDLPGLGALLDEAHDRLAALGVSTPALDELVAAARAAGALGAKLTGAGGGGAVIALAPGREGAVADAWRARGTQALACRVGVPPAPAEAA
jgi:mevalonate kinase